MSVQKRISFIFSRYSNTFTTLHVLGSVFPIVFECRYIIQVYLYLHQKTYEDRVTDEEDTALEAIEPFLPVLKVART